MGKSSLINSLKRSHVVNVGATPGLTRSMQEVQLDKNVKLLDCPGVVMLRSQSENDASIALRNCKRIEKLDDPIGPGNWIWFSIFQDDCPIILSLDSICVPDLLWICSKGNPQTLSSQDVGYHIQGSYL